LSRGCAILRSPLSGSVQPLVVPELGPEHPDQKAQFWTPEARMPSSRPPQARGYLAPRPDTAKAAGRWIRQVPLANSRSQCNNVDRASRGWADAYHFAMPSSAIILQPKRTKCIRSICFSNKTFIYSSAQFQSSSDCPTPQKGGMVGYSSAKHHREADTVEKQAQPFTRLT